MSAQGAPVRKRRKDSIQDMPVIHARNAARLVRQQRLNLRPLKIRQVKARHDQAPFESLNHCSGEI
jgi:hypothetical protein